MINKVLIVNRGEIALRIIRTCHEMGISTVAVYSTIDKESLHVKMADEAICIGNNPANESYLNINNILQAAINTNADAIHPGFGFLSENAYFAKMCEKLEIKFIGPTSELIELMGNKNNARQTMIDAGVPVVLGSEGLVADVKQAKKVALEIGLPVLIKASAGGGGKGMKVVFHEDEIENAFIHAQNEAYASFKDDSMYIEKFIENPRHIEVQVLGDNFNNVVHLFERDCSIQRNNQKIIEEAPALISKETKQKLYDAAIKACKKINYISAGTIEFIMDKNENFYFIEMNTRIQVEHPITEMITGIDLIKQQILVAQNKPLTFKQEDIKASGHAIELRINAEDSHNNFQPSAGTITALHFPGGNGVRIDSAIYSGSMISPYYDSMIAKVITYACNREEAIVKAMRCLEEIDIEGIKTNIDFLLDIILSEEFKNNNYNTSFVADFLKENANV